MFKLYNDIDKLINNDFNIIHYLKKRYDIESSIVFFYSEKDLCIDIRVTDKIFTMKCNKGFLTIVLLYFTSYIDAMSFVKKNEFSKKILFTDIYEVEVLSSNRSIINNLLTSPDFLEHLNDKNN